MSNIYDAFEAAFPLRLDNAFNAWRAQLAELSSSLFSIRRAVANGPDGRRISDLQVVSSPITVRSVRDNVSMVGEKFVLLAEIDDVHVGFCVSVRSFRDSDSVFVQVVAVAPEAQRRGVGLALLAAAAEREPRRDIVLATQDSNTAARALNERFAGTLGASIERVTLGTYRDRDLGIARGDGYRAWIIRRPRARPERGRVPRLPGVDSEREVRGARG